MRPAAACASEVQAAARATHTIVSSLPWWGRRLITVPVVLIAWALSILLSPLLFAAAARGRWLAGGSLRATPVAWRLVAILAGISDG